MNGVLGVPFIVFAPPAGVAICVYVFGKVSMAHFNPAVTVGYIITGHIRRNNWGFTGNLGANAFNHSYPIPVVFGIEVLASALLMAVIMIVVYTKGLRGFSGIVIGGIVGLNIFFLSRGVLLFQITIVLVPIVYFIQQVF